MRSALGFLLALWPGLLLAEGLPPGMMKAVRADPEAWLQDVAALIAEAGQGDAVTADQLAVSVGLLRAQARVAALSPLLGCDLDGDGAVDRAEMLSAASALGTTARSGLDARFAAADRDGDGRVTGPEMAALAEVAGMGALAPMRMAEVKVLMGFDRDGDGKVTLSEVRTGLEALVS